MMKGAFVAILIRKKFARSGGLVLYW